MSTLTLAGATASSFSGTIADNNNSGSGKVAVTYSGTGSLTLSGANSFSGGLNLNSGTLVVNNASALGTGTLTIAAGSTLNSSVSGRNRQ